MEDSITGNEDMSWNSGPMLSAAGRRHVSDVDDEPVTIPDSDERADETESDEGR